MCTKYNVKGWKIHRDHNLLTTCHRQAKVEEQPPFRSEHASKSVLVKIKNVGSIKEDIRKFLLKKHAYKTKKDVYSKREQVTSNILNG